MLLFGTSVLLGCLAIGIVSGCASKPEIRIDRSLANRYHYALGESYTTINGVRVCYEDLGRGPTIVLLHGLASSIDFWEYNIPVLALHHRVLALDIPGFGKSDKPYDHDYTIRGLAKDVLAFMDNRGVESATIVGGSMGGHIALLMALDHPDRVDKLVMMGSPGGWKPPSPVVTALFALLWHDRTVTDDLCDHWPDIWEKMFYYTTPLTEKMYRYQLALRTPRKRYKRLGHVSTVALKSIFFTSCRDRLGEVQQPVLLIWGEHDNVHPLHDAVYLREHIPLCRLVVVPDAAHEVMADQPEVFNDLVIQFVDWGIFCIKDQYDHSIKGY